MRTALFIATTALVALAACGGGETRRDEAPAAAPAKSQTLEARFERAYFALGCMANAGRDPESTFTPLRMPTDYLHSLEAEKDLRLERALDLLRTNGFPTAADFRQVETRLRGRYDYWQTVDARFIDELKKCR